MHILLETLVLIKNMKVALQYMAKQKLSAYHFKLLHYHVIKKLHLLLEQMILQKLDFIIVLQVSLLKKMMAPEKL